MKVKTRKRRESENVERSWEQVAAEFFRRTGQTVSVEMCRMLAVSARRKLRMQLRRLEVA